MADAMTGKSDLLVSVVCAVHNGQDHIGNFLHSVTALLKARYKNYEIVVVDDGSDDNTSEIIKDVQTRETNIQLYRLARSVGPDISLVAGLDQCLGDVIITLETRFDPLDPIPAMIARFEEGNDIVYGERMDRLPGERRDHYQRFARLFVWLFTKITGYDLPVAASSLRLFSRRTLGLILDNADRYSLLRVLPAFTGLRFATVPYERRDAPQHGREIVHALRRGISIILLSSVWPLRALAILSIVAAFFNLAYMVYVVTVLFVKSQVAEGWVSMSLQISGLFFLLFVVLAVLSEYIGRLFLQNQHRARYIIAEERVSESLASERLLNIYRGGDDTPASHRPDTH